MGSEEEGVVCGEEEENGEGGAESSYIARFPSSFGLEIEAATTLYSPLCRLLWTHERDSASAGEYQASATSLRKRRERAISLALLLALDDDYRGGAHQATNGASSS